MKLSVFLSAVAVLFASLFWGCSDLSVNKVEALEVELPGDFNWEEYASINKDVPGSQISFDVQKKLIAYSEFKTDSLRERVKDCMTILGDLDFAGKIYLEYASCPKTGWDQSSACTGVYANNPNYTVVVGENSTCNIGACWAGGWDEPFDCGEEICPGAKESFKEALEYKIAVYNSTGLTDLAVRNYLATEKEINMLCRFIVPRPKTSKEAEDYLKAFYSYGLNSASPVFGTSIDSLLVKQHYFIVGRAEGRPYKYCKSAYDPAKTRDVSLASKFKDSNNRTFFDYSLNTFCLNEIDNKIYVTVEDK